MNSIFQRFKNLSKILTVILGICFLLLLVLSFTRIPFDVHRWLGDSGSELTFEPSAIIMLGGSGMPSEANLIRLSYTKDLAKIYPQARVLICHPEDSSVANRMRDFLVAFATEPSRIYFNSHGNNTREQVLDIIENYPGIVNEKIVVVTSPENMLRTVKCFRKAGFVKVGGVPAYENAMFVNLSYSHKKTGGKFYIPDVSENVAVRYNFWNYLKLEITCLREMVAICYYKLNGWI